LDNRFETRIKKNKSTIDYTWIIRQFKGYKGMELFD
jgi:hypothetical protein